MTTAALRGILVVGAVILGLVVLANAFTPGVTAAPPGGSTGSTQPGATTPPAGQTASPTSGATPKDQPTPREVTAVKLTVLNGTSQSGLAATAAESLQTLGYSITKTDNAEARYKNTTLWFSKDKKGQTEVDAQHLKTTAFADLTGVVVEQRPNGANDGVDVVVIVGADYADLQG